VVAHLAPPGRRGAAIGVYGLAVAVPNLVLLPGSVPIVDRFGFGPIFWLAALPVLGAPSAVRLAPVLRNADAERPADPHASLRASLSALRGIVAPTLVLFTVTMAGGAVLTFAPQLTGPHTAALVLLIMGLAAALSRWLVGSLADRRGAWPFLAPILAGAATAMGVCGWAVARERDAVLIAAAIVLGLGYGALQNLTLVAAFAAVPPERIPAASAGWNIGFDAGTASGAVLAGVIATAYSFPVSLAALGAICLLTALVTAVAHARRRLASPPPE
jgi:predicted MFS family arabinose efflux permease